MRRTIGIIGGGRDTRILLNGLHNSKLKLKKVYVSDVNTATMERIRKDFPFIRDEGASEAAAQDVVFLSLPANALMDTLGLLKDNFQSDAIVISMIKNISFAKIALRLKNVHKFARALPSTQAFVNRGYIPVTFSSGFPESDKDDVLELFGYLGKSFEVHEDKIEAHAGLSAILPTYFWYQWKEIIDFGQRMGLTEQECINAIEESVSSTLHMIYRSGLTSDQSVDLLPIRPVDEEESEIRKVYRNRLIDLYRKARPEVAEVSVSGRT